MPEPADEAVGVDGWRGGWAVAHAVGRTITWTLVPTFAAVLAAHPGRPIAVDMPIGLSDGPRACDEAGRAFLRARQGPWQSIFLAPSGATVAALEDGLTHARAMAGRGDAPGTSVQAWNLVAKIVEVRDALASVPSVDVVEAHPECSFRCLDPRIGPASKKSAVGVGRRLRALRTVFDVPDLAEAPDSVPVDDLLDATVLAWTARRHASGQAVMLPDGATAAPRIVV